ncbi:MAG: SMC-Scp complex subunit ScpB [Chitinophaga sp.]
MEISQLIPHVEALIFAADRPLPVADILELLNNALAFLEDRATQEQVEAAIEAIQEKYNSEFYAFSIRESGGGYQFLTKKDYYQTVAQLNGEKFLKRLSTAALETLAIIAYKQPISKGEIEHIRGVSTDYSITKLLEKELIVISGRSEELPGKPLLYATSKAFMDYFGINSPADLPKLKEVFEEDFVPPTQLTLDTEELRVEDVTDDKGHLVISENGELTETTTLTVDDEAEEADGLEGAVEETDEEGTPSEEVSETEGGASSEEELESSVEVDEGEVGSEEADVDSEAGEESEVGGDVEEDDEEDEGGDDNEDVDDDDEDNEGDDKEDNEEEEDEEGNDNEDVDDDDEDEDNDEDDDEEEEDEDDEDEEDDDEDEEGDDNEDVDDDDDEDNEGDDKEDDVEEKK